MCDHRCAQCHSLGQGMRSQSLANVADTSAGALQAGVGARKKAKRGDDPIYKKPIPKGAAKPFVGLAHQLCGRDKVRTCCLIEIQVIEIQVETQIEAADLQAPLLVWTSQSGVVSCVPAHITCRESRSR